MGEKEWTEKSFLLLKDQSEPLTLTWDNLSYTVKVKKEQKVLLDRVSGWAKPGEILAIMGASGAGKTTLMNLLAKRISTGIATGTVLFNGKLPPKTIGPISGYVMQEDLFLGALTVRETLYFRAKLVLGSKATTEKINRRVEGVLDELGLRNCANSRIGNVFIRGISGGEKKRLNIGVELISQPSILFLDEPTSGLDSFTSLNVMESLEKVASNQRTIICTIHQPRSNIFSMFDKILLLSGGKTIYFGNAQECIQYFAKIGFPVPPLANPTDHFLDTISIDFRSTAAEAETRKRVENLASQFAEEFQSMNYQSQLPSEVPREVYEIGNQYTSSFLTQLGVLVHRNFYVIMRSYQATIAKIVQSLVLGLIIGLIFLQLGLAQRNVQDRQGLLFLVAVQQSFGGMFSALVLFQQEKEIFLQERRAGLYRPSSFFISKFFSEIPLALLSPLLFGIIVYFMTGLQVSAAKFGIFLGAICMGALSAQALGFAISTGTPNIEVANLIAPLFIVILFLFGGLYANLDSIPVYFIWLEYLSFIKWTYEILCKNEFDGLVFECVSGQPCSFPDGQAALEYLSMEHVEYAVNFSALAGIVVGFQIIAYLFLRFFKK